MSNKVMAASNAVALIKDGDMVATGGFVGNCHPEALTRALGERFESEGSPQNISLVYAAGQGDGKTRGLNHLGHRGLVKKVIGGHWGLAPRLQKLALENEIEAYNLPQGVIAHLFRDIAAGKPGTISRVGLKTFVDPRLEGGRLNSRTQKDIVRVMEIDDEEYLFYDTFPVDVALIRATYADEDGNAVMTKEAVTLEAISMAQAAKNSGGIVILQVEAVVKHGTLDPRLVKIPGIYVDAIVVADQAEHMQTFSEQYNPTYTGDIKAVIRDSKGLDMSIRKIIARRCAMELKAGAITNLGIGMPEGIAMVANEEGLTDHMRLTIESGPIGGIPAGGLSFGAAINPDAIIDQGYQFDYYDGGGLDIAFLGLAQCDSSGNINVSKFGPKIAGCGGFINITQNAKTVVYCGTFTAGGLKIDIAKGELIIIKEGRIKKFIEEVEQITFSGDYAYSVGQRVLYVTERGVFKLVEGGIELIEIAPGVDIQRDIIDQMNFVPLISKDLVTMDSRIFKEAPMGLRTY